MACPLAATGTDEALLVWWGPGPVGAVYGAARTWVSVNIE
jgi:hypothetical protein